MRTRTLADPVARDLVVPGDALADEGGGVDAAELVGHAVGALGAFHGAVEAVGVAHRASHLVLVLEVVLNAVARLERRVVHPVRASRALGAVGLVGTVAVEARQVARRATGSHGVVRLHAHARRQAFLHEPRSVAGVTTVGPPRQTRLADRIASDAHASRLVGVGVADARAA